MTLIETVIQRVQSQYSKGVQSKDSRLTSRHIYSCLLTGRSIILQQKYNKGQYQSQWNYSVLPCIKVIPAPLHECPCAPAGVTMLRSEFKLPQVISGIDKSLFQQISTLDGLISFDKKEYETFAYTRGRKYTSNKPFYFIRNGYLYLGAIKKVRAVMVVGLFYDPYEVYTHSKACNDCEECDCKTPMELEFPLDGELLGTVIEIASKEAIYLFSQMKEDNHNDSSDDSESKGSMVHNPDQQQ